MPKTAFSPSPAEFDVLSSLWRHRFVIVAVAIVAGIVGYDAARSEAPVYRADGSLIIRFERDYMPSNAAFESYRGEPVRVLIDGAVHTELEILGSRRMLEEALAQIGANPADPAAFAAAEQALSIRRVEGTNVVRISFEDEDPARAEAFLLALVDVYLRDRQEILDRRPEAALAEAAEAERERWLSLTREAQVAALHLEAVRKAFDDSLREASEDRPDRLAGTVRVPDTEEGRVALLADLETRRRELEARAEIAYAAYEKASRLHDEYALASRLDDAMGPVIEVLDPPAAASEPTGLSVEIKTVLAALLGVAAAGLGAIAWDWALWRRRPEADLWAERLPGTGKDE